MSNMSTNPSLSVASSKLSIVRRVSVPSGPSDAELLASLKRTLLITALETPPRFRSDIDVVMIQQHLASLGVFASVAPQILHCARRAEYSNALVSLSYICAHSMQEDVVDDYSHAYIVLEGSLCGYFNKAFSERHSRGDDFRSWNSKKTNAKGVTIDFGDLQVTYGKGAICGIDDFYSCSLSSPSRASRRHLKPHCRRRSVHSQESTTAMMLAKDSLDRVTERFGLVYERGALTSTKEISRTDVAHLALFSLLSETARRTLLQTATKRELKTGEVLFSADAEKNSSASAFAIVRNGCLNIRCVEYGDTPSPDLDMKASQSNAMAGNPNTKNTTSSAMSVPNGAVASLARGQIFGDQMVALGHTHIWASNPRRRRQVSMRFKVVAGDSSTEVLLITREQYEQLMREDHLRLSYTPIFGTACVSHSSAFLASAIEGRNISQMTRQLLTDATLSKFFFQFPPIVLERLCHHMEIQHFESHGVLLEAGGSVDSVYIVVAGSLHSRRFQGSESDRSAGNKALVHQRSARRMSLGQEVHFIPGDAFGARELMNHCYTSDAPVLVDAGTTLLCITRSTFERWASPMRHNTIVKAGSILHPFVWSATSPPASPRHSYSANYPSSLKVNRRQSGPSIISCAVVERDRGKGRRLDDAAILLKRFGLFPTLPRFLLAQMLTQASLQSKNAGEELFREGGEHRALVVILSGFVSFYSIENMSATVDMFQKHTFCIYSTFSGSTTSPEDFVTERRVEENSVAPPSSALKHRGAMHGVHIQTLPPRNAFRTGVLQDGTVCPATVVAQTDCEYFVFDEKLYAQLLVEHTPAVDMSAYASPSETSVAPVPPTSAPGSVPQPTPKPVAPKTDIPPNLLSYLEAARIPWLPLSSAKKTLLLRSMRHMHLAPGQRLIKHNEILKQLVFVVSGKLAVYVRENKEATSILNASQRSVQSAALEKSVASNYSTTSQQLYQERDGIDGISNRKTLQRKIARISEVETLDNGSEVKATSPNSRFTDFVLHAAKQAKTQQPSNAEGPKKVIPNPPVGTRRSLHSMVNKVKFQRMTGDSSASNPAAEKKESTKVLFMLHLCPGDIYGDEITAPSGTFRSVHDVYADTSLNGSSGAKDTGNNRPHVSSSPGTDVLCLDRQVFHSILAKSEEEAANELIGRSSNAKAKWQLASKRLFKRASHSTIEETEGYIKLKKTPKLFDFFKNILNQRRFLTMGTLAHFPLLRDLSDDARRELCLNARFEALDRYTDAYKGNGDANGTGHRFFLLLTGRIHLVANGPNSHVVPQNANSTTPEHNLREVGAGEGFGEFSILVPEAPAYTAALAAEPTKLLSIPADKFMIYWPCTEDARGNIEYLRSQIPSFVSLDLERIAYLYHSFSFQTHIRGTNIFQLHDTKRASAPAKEVYLIKEGTCCIRQSVTLASRPNGDYRYDPCDDECASAREDNPSPTRKTAKTIKIMATVADVGVGHVFWIDNDHDPITLVATSAAVTIASISVEKLKAIVPRGLLVGLEDLSDQLRELYAQQYQLAKRVTATVMNERLAAQSQRLPTIQRCTPQNPDNSQQPPGSILSPCGSPHRKNVDSVTDNGLDVNTDVSMHIDTVNATYRAQRRLERYNIPSEVSVTNLIGSFLDKNQAGGDTKVIDDQPEQTSTTKQDECSSAEVTAGAQQNEASSLLRLNVKIPGAGNLKGGSPSFSSITKATATSTEWRRHSIKSNRGLTSDIEKVISSNQEDLMIYEVDVRSRVRAQMCTLESPIRAMRLEPSCTPVNSLGKYFADSPSPFSRPGEFYQRQHLGLLHLPTPPTEVRTKPRHHKPAKFFRSNTKQMQAISRSDAPSHAMVTRKQGFLTALRVRNAVSFDGDERDILDTILPRVHQGRRFFYALVDSELREYADTIALQNLSQTPWIRRYSLHNPRRTCTVSDVPVTSGQAEALLRQSFLLNIDNATQLFFTAASAIDKLKWMTELSQACVLGGLQHPVSIKVRSTRPIAATPPPGDPAALAAAVIDAFKGRRKSSIKERKRSSVFVPKPKPEDTLHVEYHIS